MKIRVEELEGMNFKLFFDNVEIKLTWEQIQDLSEIVDTCFDESERHTYLIEENEKLRWDNETLIDLLEQYVDDNDHDMPHLHGDYD